MIKKRFIFSLLILGTYFLDQYSKNLVLEWVGQGGQFMPVTSFMNIVFAMNKGVTFGFLRAESSLGLWLLIGATGLISAFLLVALFRSSSFSQGVAFSLVLGGALGNITDRLRHGFVVDFIDWHYGGYHWYVFNLADCAIVGGAFLLILSFAAPQPPLQEKIEQHKE